MKIIVIALILFISKLVVQAILEYTNIIPVTPKAFIWGMPDGIGYMVGWQFVYTFWLYVLTVIIAYFLLRIKSIGKISNLNVSLIIAFSIFVFLLYINQFEFPIEKTYSPSGERINYGLIEDLVVYSFVGFLMIFLIRKFFNFPSALNL